MRAAELAQLLPGPVRRRDEWYDTTCPVLSHGDQRPSFSFCDGDRGVITKCRAGCALEQIARAVGREVRDFFFGDNGDQPGGVTVATFAAAKRLPLDFLRDHGLEDLGGAIRITYRGRDGSLAPRQRRRSALAAKDGSIWEGPKGKRPIPYGRWRLDEAMEKGELLLVEGESDTLTAWWHNIPALGIPGADMAGLLTVEDLAGIETLHVVQEPDRGGPTFVKGITARVAALGWTGRTFAVTLPAKDLNELHLTAGERFADAFAAAKAAARPVSPILRPEIADAPRPEPDLTRDGDAVVLTWPAEELVVTVSNFHDGHEGASAELLIGYRGTELHWARLPLVSTQARVTLTKKLREQAPELDWTARLERVCRLAADVLRAGDPLVALEPRMHDLTERYAVVPILPRGQTALLYVHGGGGKSLTGLVVSVVTATGLSVAGLRPCVTGPVIYYDWESTQDEHETRLARVTCGLGLDPATLRGRLYYRPMAGHLADDARRLRQDVARLGAVLLVVDSVVPAAGPEAEGSEAAVRLMSTLRSLGPGVSRLLLGHVSKGDAVQSGPTHPFGSVFYWNLSRSVWELRADDEDRDHLHVSLTHKKVNAGPKLPTFGLDFHFLPDRITVSALDLADQPALTRSASQTERFLLALRTGPLTTKGMAVTLDTTDAIAGAVGRRLYNRGKVVRLPLVPPHEDGSTFKWATAARRPETEA